MKNAFYLIVLLLMFLTSCNKNVEKKNEMAESEPAKEASSLKGVWELVSFCNYGANGQVDTINASKDYRQIKMYTDSKIMWSRFAVSDSIDWFGYGTYTNTNTSLSEALDYGSKAMNPVIMEIESFDFNLVLGKDKFTQIEIDEAGSPIIAENYIRIE